MFTITHHLRAQSDQSCSPELECLRAADAAGLAHQIPNDSSHRFHGAGGGGQLQIGMFAIGSELVGPPEKLPHYHTGAGSTARLTDQPFQTQKDPLQLGAIGKLQRLAGKLVAKFTHGSAYHFSLSRSPIALQLADEMKMAQLRDPASARGQGGGAPNLVGNQGSNALLRSDRNGADGLRPPADLFPTRKKQRVEEKSVVLMTGLQGHQIQHPRTLMETKVKSVDQKDQWAHWHTQGARSGRELVHSPTKTVTQGLRSKPSTGSKTFQSSSLQQHRVQKSGRSAPTLAASFFSADAPRAPALAALTTPRAEAMNFGSTTRRFHVRRIHARELSAY